MVLVWHEKASRNVLQTGSLFLAHAPETLSYLNPTVKEGAEQCCNYNYKVIIIIWLVPLKIVINF